MGEEKLNALISFNFRKARGFASQREQIGNSSSYLGSTRIGSSYFGLLTGISELPDSSFRFGLLSEFTPLASPGIDDFAGTEP